MKRILLIGHDGQIGGELLRALAPLGQVTAVCYPQLDFAVPDSIIRTVREHRPELIVNAAAYTAVDNAESEPDQARKLNADAPMILADEARRLGVGLIHYSTDYVFDGLKRTPYTETDAPNPLSVYGRTKLEGDRAIQASGAAWLIFRTAWVYGQRGKNFFVTIRRLAEEGAPLRIVTDQIGCPTWCRTIAETTASVLAVLLAPRAPFSMQEVSGLYHAACAGETSWYGFARAFVRPSVPIQPIASADHPPRSAKRPAYSVLDGSKLRQTFGIAMPAWDEALRQCLRSGEPADGMDDRR